MNRQKPETHHIRNLRTTGGWLMASLAVVLFSFGGCATEDNDTGEGNGVVTASFALNRFANCDSMDDYLTEVISEMVVRAYVYGSYGYHGGALAGGAEPSRDWDDGAAPPTNTEGGGEGADQSPTDYTTTNVQEVDVDEPDLMKTDGDYIYVLEENVLFIVDSWPPADAELISTIELPGYGSQMFLEGDLIVAFTDIYEDAYDYCGSMYAPCRGGGGGAVPTPDQPPRSDVDGDREEPGDTGAPDEPGDDPSDDSEPEYTESFYGTRISVIDVSDRTSPELVTEFDVEGSFVAARMVDGIVYSAHMANIYDGGYELYNELEAAGLPEIDWDTTYEERQALEDDVLRMVTPIVADWVATKGRDAIIPDLRVNGEDRDNLLSCTDILRPGVSTDLGMLSVVALDVDGDDGPVPTGLLANGWQVYGSTTSMYIAQDSRWWMFEDGEDRVTKTHVHRFELNAGKPRYAASGEVPGWVLNQYSMSEYDGYFRIATTDETNNGWWWGEDDVMAGGDGGAGVSNGTTTTDAEPPPGTDSGSAGSDDIDEPEPAPEPEPEVPLPDANNLFVLAQNANVLDIVGEVRGMAPGQQIYAVRFIGDRGFIVTFRQVDPLHALDLSDPTNPQELGELEIPGFSTYLHPLGEDHLIGIGRTANEWGGVEDLQLQLFDVSDMTNPTRIHQHVLSMGDSGWSSSAAEHDPHAFTFWANQNLLAIPVTLEDWNYESDGYRYFSGVIVYEVTPEDGFVEVGRVSHSSMAVDRYCGYYEGYSECYYEDYFWQTWMQRSAFMEGEDGDKYLYAISNMGVSSCAVDELSEPLSLVSFWAP